MTDDQQRAFYALWVESQTDKRPHNIALEFFEAGLAAAKPRASTVPGPYSLEVRTEAASIALLAAELATKAKPQTWTEEARENYIDAMEVSIAERLHALEGTTIEQTAERLIEAVRMEAAR